MKHECEFCGKKVRTERGLRLHKVRLHKVVETTDEGQIWETPEPGPIAVVADPPQTGVRVDDTVTLDSSLDGLKDDPCGFVRLEAESRADEHGHSLGDWQARGTNSAQATCQDCGRVAAYALSPPPGGQKVVGEAVNEPCR